MISTNCGDDDSRLFTTWVNEHGRAIRGFLAARVGCADLADELCQEVFHRAWTARRRYKEQNNARAYLFRVADRLVRDDRKAKRPVNLDEKTWRQIEPSSHDGEPSRAAVRAEDAERLASVIERLPPQQRRVLLLRYYGQLSFAEIAEIVGCPMNTALSHCRRGLEALRKLMGEDES